VTIGLGNPEIKPAANRSDGKYTMQMPVAD